MKKNYRGEDKDRMVMHFGQSEQKLLHDLAGVWRKRNGDEMRYKDIVNLALYNLASQSDIDCLPYLHLVEVAFKECTMVLKDLESLRVQYADKILSDPALTELYDRLSMAVDVAECAGGEVRRLALCSGGGATVSPDAGELEG